MHKSHVRVQRVLIGRHLAAQLARDRGHLMFARHVLAQIVLVQQPVAAHAALHLRATLANVDAPLVQIQLGLRFERGRTAVANVRRIVHALDVRGHLPLGVETVRNHERNGWCGVKIGHRSQKGRIAFHSQFVAYVTFE